MSFSASWLALREPIDHAARPPALTDALRGYLAALPGARIGVLDLACGSGSNRRFLAPALGRDQHWTMVDNDNDLLALAADGAGRIAPAGTQDGREGGASGGGKVGREGGVRGGVPGGMHAEIETVCLDLVAGLARLPVGAADLVTASALLDLVSGEWLARLLDLPALRRPALLFALSYDGSMQWQPVLPEDDWTTGLFNRHQRTDKGFGPALGPEAAGQAACALRERGYRVATAASDWMLRPADDTLQQAMVAGIAEAVGSLTVQGSGDAARLRNWVEQRLALVAAGRSHLRVGHTDLLALPASGRGD